MSRTYKPGRTHFSRTGHTDDFQTVCGHTPNNATTTDPAEVTCKGCLRALARVEVAAAEERDRRGDHQPAVWDQPQPDVGAVGRLAIARSIAGEPVETRTRWSCGDAARAAMARQRDHARSVASGSNPDRFGGIESDGRVPTVPPGTREELLDVETTWADAHGARTMVGTEVLAPSRVEFVADRELLGVAPESKRIPKTKGGRWQPDREPAVRSETADLAGLTEHQVGMVSATVRERHDAALAAKGLIPAPRTVPRRRTEDARDQERNVAKAIGYDVNGWKGVADVMDKSEGWCRERAAQDEDPLPVKRLGREVHARRVDLLEWLRRQMRAA